MEPFTIVMGASAVIGAASSLIGGSRSRKAQRRAERRARAAEKERQRQVEEQRRIAEEQARIEREKLLQEIGLERTSLHSKEKSFRIQQETEQKQISEKVNSLLQNYKDIFSNLTSQQTIRGISQTLVPTQNKLTRNYLKDQDALMLVKDYKTRMFEQNLGALETGRQRLDVLEQYGKESSTLNLRSIQHKTESELQSSQFRIDAMRSELRDFETASKINDFSTLLKMGVTVAKPYMKKSLYSRVFPKSKYKGENYDELMDSLTWTGERASSLGSLFS